MTKIARAEDNHLTPEEAEQFHYHSEQIKLGIKEGQSARNMVISHVLSVIDQKLWREHYSSEEDYVKTELNIEMSSFWRNVRNNKNYLYLVANTEDIDEQITLSRMRDAAYRELRRLATDNTPLLKKGAESEEDYKNSLIAKEESDAEMVLDLWKSIYPKVAQFKKQSNTGIYPTGGFSITAKDITETAVVLHQALQIPRLLEEGVDPKDISVSTLNGVDISLQEVIEKGGDKPIEVIESLRELGVLEALTEKGNRQGNHIRDSLENRYEWDRYTGFLIYKDGDLIIENEHGDYNLAIEFADMLNKETSISIRRNKSG